MSRNSRAFERIRSILHYRGGRLKAVTRRASKQPGRRGLNRWVDMEALEPRVLLSADAPVGTFAQLHGQIDEPGGMVRVPITILTEDFTLRHRSAVFRINASGTGGGELDPAAVVVRNAGGRVVTPWYTTDNAGGSSDGVILVRLGSGSYTVEVRSEEGSTGDYRVDVGLAGDVDGDGDVDRIDRRAVRRSLSTRRQVVDYNPDADVDRDGVVTRFDHLIARINRGDATTLRPLELDVAPPVRFAEAHGGGGFLTTAPALDLVGSVGDGTEVLIGAGGALGVGQQVSVDEEGRFFSSVALAGGSNTFTFRANDRFGQSTEAYVTVDFDQSLNGDSIGAAGLMPMPFDFNVDELVDAVDIDILSAAIRAGSTAAGFDLNGDGAVDLADQNYLVEDVLGTVKGDLNLDRDASVADLAVFALNFGSSGVGWAEGDNNGDGAVGVADLASLALNFGHDGPDIWIIAALTEDPAPSPPADGSTAVAAPIVTGLVDSAATVVSLRAGLNATAAPDFTDLTAELQAGNRFTLDLADLEGILGARMPDGAHTLHLMAQDDAANEITADVGILLDAFGPIGLATSIPELAGALGFDPLAMFEYVTNNIEYELYAGALKGPLATFQTKAGNDWDQASLLAGLFAEAGITTRYASREIQVPIQQAMDYIGATDPGAAATILANAGLNVVSVSVGGTLTYYWLERTWLEADVPLPGGGTETVLLDPAWKFKDRQPGMTDILSVVPFDESSYFAAATTQLASEFYREQVRQYLATTVPGVSVADVPFDGPIINQHFDALPTELPYEFSGRSTTTDLNTAIPAENTHRVQIDLDNGGSLFSTLLAVPDVSLDRLTISFADAGGGMLIPELRRNGVVIETGANVDNNSNVVITLTHFDADGNNVADRSFSYPRLAGEYIAVGLGARQRSQSSINALQAELSDATLARANGLAFTEDDLIGGLLDLGAAKWFYEAGVSESIINSLTSAVGTFNVVDSGLATASGVTTMFADVQNPFVPDSVNIDLANIQNPSYAIDFADPASDPHAQDRDFILGFDSSALEHAIWEELVNTESISTIKSLQLANERGVPVLVINRFMPNVLDLLGELTHPTVTINSVIDDLNLNFHVTIPRDPTPLGDWDGVGYISRKIDLFASTDPNDPIFTGEEKFIIFGGLAAAGGDAAEFQPTAAAIQGGQTTGNPEFIVVIDPDTEEWVQTNVGDPINIANGNVQHDEKDIALPGVGVPLKFERFYDSRNEADKGLGVGWSFTYSDRLQFEMDGSVLWFDDRGDRLRFTPDGAGGYITGESIFGTFTDTGTGFLWTNRLAYEREFDTTGRLIRMADRFGNGVVITYDASGNIDTVTDLVVPSRTLGFTYNSDNHITAITDFIGRTWTYDYDADGRLTSVTDPSDADTPLAVTQYTYYTDPTLDGLLQEVTNPNGGTVLYEYYANRRGRAVTDPEGFTHYLSYNTFRNRTTFTDERGTPAFYEHNDQGNLTRLVHADGATTTNVWTNNLLMSTTDTFGNTESFTYDAQGDMIEKLDRGGFTTTFTYDPTFGNVTHIGRPDLRTTDFTYDVDGNLIQITDALGGVTTMTYNSRGLLETRTLPNGNATAAIGDFTTTYTYDDAGRILTRSTDLPSTESFTYDAAGNMLTRTDANTHTTTFTYDLLGRVLTETDALMGNPTTFSYDAFGNLLAVTDPLLRTTSFTYDQRNRVVKTTFADGSTIDKTYDAVGNLTAQIDQLGRVTQHTYDARNRRVATVFNDGTSVMTDYDGAGQVVRIVDALGNESFFDYDPMGNLVATTDSLGNTTTRAYDANGNVVSITDANTHQTIKIYDELNRLVQITEADPDDAGPLTSPVTTFDYDANGNLTLITDANTHTETKVYDVLDRLIQVIGADPDDAGPKPAPVTEFTYDAVGNLLTTKDPNGNITTNTYDDVDRLTKITDPDPDDAGPQTAPVTDFTYDAVGNLLTVQDPNGNMTTNTYDDVNRLVKVVGADPDDTGPQSAPVTEFTYDAVGNLLTTKDPNGHITANTYNDFNRLVQVTRPDPDGAGPLTAPVTTRAYDANGSLVLFIDARTNIAEFEYDALGRQTIVRDDLGNELKTEYDAVGNIAAIVDPRTNRTEYEYDALNRRILARDPLGNERKTEYDAVGNVTATVDPLLNRTVFEYDALNRLTIARDPFLNEVTSDYDANGNVISLTDANVHTTTNTYDNLNRLIKVTQPDPDDAGPLTSPVTEFTYDAAGNLLATKDANGQVTTNTYDNLNRLIRTTLPDPDGAGPLSAPITGFTYDDVGNLSVTTDPNGGITTNTYDALNRLIEVTQPDPDGAGPLAAPVIGRSYDANGNLTSITDALMKTTEFEYDELNRQVLVRDPLLNESTFAYDEAGNLIKTTNALLQETTSEYDELNRRVLVRDALLKETTFTYDENGNLATTTDPLTNTTEFEYDAINRRVLVRDPLLNETILTYDPASNLTGITDRNGRTTEIDYDNLNRQIEQRWRDSSAVLVNTVAETYDPLGRVLTTADDNSSYSFDYDNLGRLIQADNAGTPGVPNVVLDYTYDANNNLLAVTDTIDAVASGTEVFTYDALDRVTRITQTGTGVNDKRVDYTYDPTGRVLGIDRFADLAAASPVAATGLGYNDAGWLTDITHSKSAGADTLAAYTFIHDDLGRITTANTPDGVNTYTFDDRGQLTATASATTPESFTYDDNGNRTNTGYSTGTNNRLRSDGTFNYDYDNEGNRIRSTHIATGAVTEYEYDNRNRLTRATDKAALGGAATQVVEYTYDALNRRIARAVDADGDGAGGFVSEHYTYDRDDMHLQFDGGGSLTHRYMHGLGTDQIIADDDGTEVLWALTDHQGSVRDLVDNSASVVNHIVYDSFGNVVSQLDPAVTTQFSFTGREFDADTGLYYFRARFYDAATGRFIGQDPLGFSAGDVNLYRYVQNDPVNNVDPSGMTVMVVRNSGDGGGAPGAGNQSGFQKVAGFLADGNKPAIASVITGGKDTVTKLLDIRNAKRQADLLNQLQRLRTQETILEGLTAPQQFGRGVSFAGSTDTGSDLLKTLAAVQKERQLLEATVGGVKTEFQIVGVIAKEPSALSKLGSKLGGASKVLGPIGAGITGVVAYKSSAATTETGKEVDGVLIGASSLHPAVGILQVGGAVVDLGASGLGVENAGVGNVISAGNAISITRAAVTDLGSALFSTDPKSSGRELRALNNALLSGKQGKFSQILAKGGSVLGEVAYEYNPLSLGKKALQGLGLIDDPTKPTRGPTVGLNVQHDSGEQFTIEFNEKDIGSYDGATDTFTFTDAFANSKDKLELARLEKEARGQLVNDWEYEFKPPK